MGTPKKQKKKKLGLETSKKFSKVSQKQIPGIGTGSKKPTSAKVRIKKGGKKALGWPTQITGLVATEQ